MDLPECPICGKKINDEEYALLDNGSPAHYQCVENYEPQKEY